MPDNPPKIPKVGDPFRGGQEPEPPFVPPLPVPPVDTTPKNTEPPPPKKK
jgi:hypothetical protein